MLTTDKTCYPSVDKPWLKHFKLYDSDVEKLFDYENISKSFFENMLNLNKNRMDWVAIDYFGNEITYGNMIEKINRIVELLKIME